MLEAPIYVPTLTSLFQVFAACSLFTCDCASPIFVVFSTVLEAHWRLIATLLAVNLLYKMMNWYSQLTRLILDFYREDPSELNRLSILYSCKLSRWWGVLRIHCRDLNTAEALIAAGGLLKEPIAQLRLAHQIKILVQGDLIATLALQEPFKADSESDRNSYGEPRSW